MTKKRLKSLCRLYDYIYTDKPYKNTKTVSFILYRNRIVAFGVNSDKTSPMQNLYRERTPLKDIKNFILEASEAARIRRRTVNMLDIGDGSMSDVDEVDVLN